jgi:hypothetical protein
MDLGAELSDDDVARADDLATKLFDASALTLRVATVTATTLSFLVGHDAAPCLSEVSPLLPSSKRGFGLLDSLYDGEG